MKRTEIDQGRKLKVRESRFMKSAAERDLIVICILSVAVFLVSAGFDVFNKIISWIYRHDSWQLDEVFTLSIFLIIASGVFAFRRYRELNIQTERREHAEAENAQLVPELERARDDVTAFRKILPVCPSCKRIRDTAGHWHDIETYLQVHYPAKIDEGVCPDCARRAYNTLFLQSHKM